MSWSYNLEGLASTPKDQVRLIIGDIDKNDGLLQDEEISYFITARGSIWAAAAQCCFTLSAKFARQADTTTGELRTLYSSRSRAYAARSAQLEDRANSLGGALPYVGGISITDKVNTEQNPDRVPPQFNVGMDDNWNQPIAPAGNEPSVPIPEGSTSVV